MVRLRQGGLQILTSEDGSHSFPLNSVRLEMRPPVRKIEHLPNAITISRVALVPVLVLLLRDQRFPSALAVFALAGLSDALDGYIAKRYGLVSQFGAILDPLADKILLVTSYVMLAVLSLIPFWLVVAVVSRDLLIVGGYLAYTLAAGTTVQMRPTALSKLNTLLQILLVIAVLAQAALGVQAHEAIAALIGAALGTTVASGLHYLWTWGVMRQIQTVARAPSHD